MVAQGDSALDRAVSALTPRMQRVLVDAHRTAADREMTWLGTEHVLLALIEDGDGIAGQVLRDVGVADVVRDEIEKILSRPTYQTSPERYAP